MVVKDARDRLLDKYQEQAQANADLAKRAVEIRRPVFFGVWGPADEALYLVSEAGLQEYLDKSGK